jgi:hypothetical protein
MGERDSLTTGLILLLIIVPLALVGFVLFGPNLTKHLGQAAIGGVLLLIVGALFKGLAWAYRSGTSSIRQEAELSIVEELSLGSSLTRRSLLARIRKGNWIFYVFRDSVVLALNTLYKRGTIVIEHGQYSLSGGLREIRSADPANAQAQEIRQTAPNPGPAADG